MHFQLFTISFREITSIGISSKVEEKLTSLKRLLLLSSLEIEDLDGEGKAGSKKDSESNYCTSCTRQVISLFVSAETIVDYKPEVLLVGLV